MMVAFFSEIDPHLLTVLIEVKNKILKKGETPMSELLSHKNLQTTIKELNAKLGLKLKFIITRENAISQIVDTIGNATEEQQEMLSPEAVDVYNALLAAAPAVEEVKVTNPTPSGEEDMCQAYGVLYEGADPECQACDQAEDCQEKTMMAAAAKSVAKKEKKVKEVKEKAPKAEVVKSRYGSKVGSMSAAIDDMLWAGTSKKDMITSIMDGFGKDEKAATGKVKVHLNWLKKEKGMNVVETDGIYKVM
jgi:hypothetical protein